MTALRAADIAWSAATVPPPDPRAADQALETIVAEAASYRLLAQEAIQALAGLTTEHGRLRARYHALLEELRARRDEIARYARATVESAT